MPTYLDNSFLKQVNWSQETANVKTNECDEKRREKKPNTVFEFWARIMVWGYFAHSGLGRLSIIDRKIKSTSEELEQEKIHILEFDSWNQP